MYAYMARISGKDECPSGNFGDSSQLTNCFLDSGTTCQMKPEVYDFIPGLLEDTDGHIEFSDGNHVTAKRKVQGRIKMCDNNGDPLIATLHNVLLAPYLCDRLFLIIVIINLGNTCLLHKNVFVHFTSDQKRKMPLHYHTVHQGNIHFWGK